VKEVLEMWDMHYGEFLPEIRALTRHMKEFLRLEMPDINVNTCPVNYVQLRPPILNEVNAVNRYCF
jgi:hypothetical protein